MSSARELVTNAERPAEGEFRHPLKSYVYHSHRAEDEVGAGDFMGFPTPSVAHHLRNPFDEDLVYLCGGEIRDLEVAEYPRNQLVLIRRGDEAHVVPSSAVRKIR